MLICTRGVAMTILVDTTVGLPRSIETDTTWVAKVIRRSRFFVRYLRAQWHRERLNGLMAAVNSSFSDSKGWVAERRLELRMTSGPSVKKGDISWDAPIVVVVMYRDENGNLKEACGISLYIKQNALYIKQLQGGASVKFPRKFKVWPLLFVKSCMAFAQAAGFEKVHVASAESLYPFHNPGLGPDGVTRSGSSVREHQERMKFRYNQTATNLSFKKDGNWFVWNTGSAS